MVICYFEIFVVVVVLCLQTVSIPQSRVFVFLLFKDGVYYERRKESSFLVFTIVTAHMFCAS